MHRRRAGIVLLVAVLMPAVGWADDARRGGPDGVGSPSRAAAEGADDGGAPDPFAPTLVDVAVLRGPGPAARLLVVEDGDPIRLGILERIGLAWARLAEGRVRRPIGALGRPWLVRLDAGRFALLVGDAAEGATAGRRDRTHVIVLDLAAGAIRKERSRSVDLVVDDAQTADVDGDRRPELILAAASTTRSGGTCQGSTVVVLDGGTLARHAEHDIEGVRLATAVVAEFDGKPGAELVGTAFRNCPAGPDQPGRLTMLALDLVSGERLPVAEVATPVPATAWASRLLAADLDGDGSNEVIVRDGLDLVVLEPSRGWARTPVLMGDVTPLAAVRSEGRGLVAALDEDAARLVSVERTDDGFAARVESVLDAGPQDRSRWDRTVASAARAVVREEPAALLVADLDGDGCREILVPGFSARCAGRPGGPRTLETGPSWLATRPLLVVDEALVVARTVGWPEPWSLPDPAPLTVHDATSGWRHGPSAPFVLAEVALSDLVPTGPRRPRPPDLGTVADGDPPTVAAVGRPGQWLLARVRPANPAEPFADDAGWAGLGAFLREPAAAGEARVLLPVSTEGSSAIPLSRVAAAGPWEVTLVALDARGELSRPVRALVTDDVTGPAVGIEAPALVAPWPLEARLAGRSEPGARVRIGAGPEVTVGDDGAFELPARLAPWPQMLEVLATDAAGNETTVRLSLVGGFDWRLLPWAWLVVGGVLGAVAVSTLRDAGRAAPRWTAPVGDAPPDLEELS